MVIRNIEGINWQAISPSKYRLMRFPQITVEFNGINWNFYFSNLDKYIPVVVSSMNEASQLLQDVYKKEGIAVS